MFRQIFFVLIGFLLLGPVQADSSASIPGSLPGALSEEDRFAAGWRRTADGWENRNTWEMLTTAASIGGSLATIHPVREVWWISHLGSIHPSAIATLQILIALILLNVRFSAFTPRRVQPKRAMG